MQRAHHGSAGATPPPPTPPAPRPKRSAPARRRRGGPSASTGASPARSRARPGRRGGMPDYYHLELCGTAGIVSLRGTPGSPVWLLPRAFTAPELEREWRRIDPPPVAPTVPGAAPAPAGANAFFESNRTFVADLLGAVEEDRPTLSDVHAAAALEMIAAVYASHLTGARVALRQLRPAAPTPWRPPSADVPASGAAPLGAPVTVTLQALACARRGGSRLTTPRPGTAPSTGAPPPLPAATPAAGRPRRRSTASTRNRSPRRAISPLSKVTTVSGGVRCAVGPSGALTAGRTCPPATRRPESSRHALRAHAAGPASARGSACESACGRSARASQRAAMSSPPACDFSPKSTSPSVTGDPGTHRRLEEATQARPVVLARALAGLPGSATASQRCPLSSRCTGRLAPHVVVVRRHVICSHPPRARTPQQAGGDADRRSAQIVALRRRTPAALRRRRSAPPRAPARQARTCAGSAGAQCRRARLPVVQRHRIRPRIEPGAVEHPNARHRCSLRLGGTLPPAAVRVRPAPRPWYQEAQPGARRVGRVSTASWWRRSRFSATRSVQVATAPRRPSREKVRKTRTRPQGAGRAPGSAAVRPAVPLQVVANGLTLCALY